MSNVSVRSDPTSFFERYSRGEALPDEIDDFIDLWHERADDRARTLPLHEYLGLSREEYEVWVRFPDALPQILIARRDARSPIDVLGDNLDELPTAARAVDDSRVRALREWLLRRRKR
jgi:hypothetical protein